MKRTTPSAVISADAEFREIVSDTLGALNRGIVVGIELTLPFDQLRADRIQELRQANPELLFLDLGDDTERGIRLAQHLSEANPKLVIIAAGASLAPEVLLSAMQAGVSEYLTKPVSPEALTAALDRVQRKLAAPVDADAKASGEVFSFFSVKGGCGTTTVATNVAVELQQLTGKRTLLVDLDLELGSAAALLGMQPRFSFVDMVRNLHRMDGELMASYVERHESGVQLLAAPFNPERTETLPADSIRKLLQFLRQQYDYIVLDTQKTLSPVTAAALAEADWVFLVTAVDLPSLRNLKRFLPLLDRATGKSADKIRLVVNRYQPEGMIGLDKVESTAGIKVHRTLRDDVEPVLTSVNGGTPAVLEGKSPFAQDVRALSMELARIDATTNGRHGALGSILKIFGRKKEVPAHV